MTLNVFSQKFSMEAQVNHREITCQITKPHNFFQMDLAKNKMYYIITNLLSKACLQNYFSPNLDMSIPNILFLFQQKRKTSLLLLLFFCFCFSGSVWVQKVPMVPQVPRDPSVIPPAVIGTMCHRSGTGASVFGIMQTEPITESFTWVFGE